MEPQATDLDRWVLSEIQVREQTAHDECFEKAKMERVIQILSIRYRRAFWCMISLGIWALLGWLLMLWLWLE